MNKANVIVLMMGASLALSGCSRPVGTQEGPVPGTGTQRQSPVTESGRQAAVISLHQQTRLINGCRFGLTLTNNLRLPITDVPLFFTAYDGNGVRLQRVTRAFFGIDPTKQQFAEITFQFECAAIKRIGVSDPGRCIVGGLPRRARQPGDCLDLVDLPGSPFVQFVKEPAD